MADKPNAKHKATPKPGEWHDVLAPEIIQQYEGKHVAIVYKRVVAVGDTYEYVLEEARKLHPDETPYLMYIPHVDEDVIHKPS